MARRPAWDKLPKHLQRLLSKYIHPGESIRHPKRKWLPDALIFTAYIAHVERGRSGWQASRLVAHQYHLTDRGVEKIVKRYRTTQRNIQ